MERDVIIPMRDGVELCADVFRPDAPGRFPAILGFHPYDPFSQTGPIMPRSFASVTTTTAGMERGNGPLEAGDPTFFVRRGYVHVVANVRGTGKSGGFYDFLGETERRDGYDLIEWLALEPYVDGNVGMFGVSYFGRIQQFIASTNPPHLKCIFAPWASTDQYRDALYHGGILGKNWALSWTRAFSNLRYRSESLGEWGEDGLSAAIDRALLDEEIAANPELVDVLTHPREGSNPLVVDILVNPLDGPFWEKRKVPYEDIRVPAYIGADWGMYGLHLPGALRSWERLQGPRKLLIGPPAYLDRPLYQLQYESLAWFDYWLKGMPNPIMDEAPVRLYVTSTGEWREATEWPLPQTRWTPFYLHENRRLWEREHFQNEGLSSFFDSPWERGALEFTTPPLVEVTEVMGPAVLELYASTTDEEVLWFVSLWEVDAQGKEAVLTRGWLRGSQREIDPERSLPWAPYHPHTRRDPLRPGEIYRFWIPFAGVGQRFSRGSRIRLKIRCSDDEKPANSLEALANGHVRRQTPARITVFHNSANPSCLYLPITAGNIIGTFIEGASPYFQDSGD